MASAFSMNSFLGQRILALVRDGDYAHAGEEEAIELAMADVAKDAGEPFLRNPPLLAVMPERLAAAGWRAAGTRELHDRYIGWYRTLVGKIERSRDRIVAIAGPEGYGHVLALYQGLVDAAVAGRLGAAIVTAERIG